MSSSRRLLLIVPLVIVAMGCTRGPRDVAQLHTLATDPAMAVEPPGGHLSESRDDFTCRGRFYADLPTLVRRYSTTASRGTAFADVRAQLLEMGWQEVPPGPYHQDVAASMIFTRSFFDAGVMKANTERISVSMDGDQFVIVGDFPGLGACN